MKRNFLAVLALGIGLAVTQSAATQAQAAAPEALAKLNADLPLLATKTDVVEAHYWHRHWGWRHRWHWHRHWGWRHRWHWRRWHRWHHWHHWHRY